METNNYQNLITVKFARAEQPKFEERKGKGYVENGADNNYPDYLLNLFDESPKHGAILKGKANYIYGKGFEGVTAKANTAGEFWNQILKKCVIDDEVFGGYYLQIIYNLLGAPKDIFHLPYRKVRASKDGSKFYVKEDWTSTKEKERCYDAFNPKAEKPTAQILFVKQYNPKSDVYPLPSYFQGLNYIESDIQVSRHILGNAKEGFVPGTLINLNGGEPEEEAKAAVEGGIKKKFTGSEGDRVIIMFNSSKDNAAEIIPLSSTMLTKEDFTNVNSLIQQEIFACHQITSPELFGISTPGALGGRTVIRDSYQIFANTYVNERQQEHEANFNKLFGFCGIQADQKITPVEPLAFEFGEAVMSQNLTKDEIREIMGKDPLDPSIKTQAQIISDNINALSPLVANKVLESMTPDEIRSLAGLVPATAGAVVGDGSMPAPAPVGSEVNSNLKSMTGKEFQHLDRTVKRFKKGTISRQQAAMILKESFGMSDENISIMLDEESSDAQFATQDEIDFLLIEQFNAFGEDINDYEVLSYKPAKSSEYFADVKQLSELENSILGLIKKEPNVLPESLASALKVDVKVVNATISTLEKIGRLVPKITGDGVIERKVVETNTKVPTIDILLRYSYSWRPDVPQGERDTAAHPSRPFCVKMMELSTTKLWSRSDIERISERLGYSVFDRVGGWFTQPDGQARPSCRHTWQALTVLKKNK